MNKEATKINQPWPENPLTVFSAWFKESEADPNGDPSAMILSTASPDGVVSSRVVLLKDYGNDSFVFYTNYNSRKGSQISSNSHGSLVFYWPRQGRQVRVEGLIEKTTEEESDRYFRERAQESQIGAWASEQSTEIESRNVLEERYKIFAEKFGNSVPRPPHWGGYRLVAGRIEFWQEGAHRLHDRIVYTKSVTRWKRVRLAP